MTSGLRRRALVLAGGMGIAGVAGGFARPRRLADDRAELSLEHLFPRDVGPWRVDPVAAALVRPAEGLARTLYQQLLERTYVDAARRRVMLSVAYGREQASSLELHWPEVCYRYGGFTVSSRHVAEIVVGGRMVTVTRLLAELPMRSEPVTYWTLLGGERTPDANTFRLRRLAHAVRREIADGMLVRVSSIDPNVQRGYALQTEFIDALVRALPPADRVRVEGIPAAAA